VSGKCISLGLGLQQLGTSIVLFPICLLLEHNNQMLVISKNIILLNFRLKKTAEHRKIVLQRKQAMEERKAAVPFSEIAADRSSGKVTSHVRLQQYVEKFGERASCKVFTKPQLQTLCKAYGLQVTARANKSTLTKELLPLIKESARMPHPYHTDQLESRVSVDDNQERITLRISIAN